MAFAACLVTIGASPRRAFGSGAWRIAEGRRQLAGRFTLMSAIILTLIGFYTAHGKPEQRLVLPLSPCWSLEDCKALATDLMDCSKTTDMHVLAICSPADKST
jgi:hypothetical protein